MTPFEALGDVTKAASQPGQWYNPAYPQVQQGQPQATRSPYEQAIQAQHARPQAPAPQGQATVSPYGQLAHRTTHHAMPVDPNTGLRNPYAASHPAQPEKGFGLKDGALLAADVGAGFIPGVGTLWHGGRAIHNISQGKWGEGLAGLGLAAVSAVPLLGGVANTIRAARAAHGAVRAAHGAAKALPAARQAVAGTQQIVKNVPGSLRNVTPGAAGQMVPAGAGHARTAFQATRPVGGQPAARRFSPTWQGAGRVGAQTVGTMGLYGAGGMLDEHNAQKNQYTPAPWMGNTLQDRMAQAMITGGPPTS